MAYATVADYIAAFTESEAIQVSNLDRPSATAVDESRIQSALADAAAEIDGYIYQFLPLEAIPRPLRRWCLVVARKNLHVLGGHEVIAEDYRAAIQWLRDVRDNKTSLGLDVATGEALPSPLGVAEVANSGSTTFAEALNGY